MITVLFTIIVILNALMLLGLIYTIYKANISDFEDVRLEKIQDILILGLFIGIVAAIGLSAVIIL